MTDPLSSVAFVRAVAACAGDFTRFLLKTFRGVAFVPDHYVHELLTALESLQIKWLTAGEQQTQRFLGNIRLYQAEIFSELLMLLV